MLVRMFMSRDLVTTGPEAEWDDLESLMQRHKVRRLPILEQPGDRMIGIVAPIDMAKNHRPEVRARDIMTEQVITTTPDSPLEEVAGLMKDLSIGALPVMEKGKLVGIISQGDVFGALSLLLTGGSGESLRITFECVDTHAPLAFLMEATARHRGSLQSVVSYELGGQRFITARIRSVDAESFLDELWSSGHRVHKVQGAPHVESPSKS